MQSATTMLGYLRPVLRLLASHGLDPHQLLEAHGMPASAISESQRRVPVAVSRAWIGLAHALTREPLWLALVKNTHYHDFGGLGLALEAGGNAAEVLQRLATYHALVSDAASLTVRPSANGCRLSIIPNAYTPPHRQSLIYLMALLLHFSRLRATPPFRAITAGLPGASLEERHSLADFAGLPVVDADDFHIDFTGASLDVLLKDSDREMAHTMEIVLQQRLSAQQRTLTTQVQQWLRLNMSDTVPRLQVAARALHMSERTLQRRLQTEGLTWRELVEKTRLQMMDTLIDGSGLPITDLALTLGYTHATSFSRAFRRQYGMTPRHYRKQRTHTIERQG